MLRNLRRDELPKWSQKQLENVIQRLAQELERLDHVEEAILFGSAARGEFDDLSDLDVLLIVPDRSKVKECLTRGNRLRSKLPCSLDVVCMSRRRFNELKGRGGVAMEAATYGRVLVRSQC